jgi:transcriptional regulator with XRE-family HTH domain
MRPKIDTTLWPELKELRKLRNALGATQLARRLGCSRSALSHYLNCADARDNTHATLKSDAAFTARLQAAIRAGRESAASASARVALKPAKTPPRRVHAIAVRSYCGSSAAWCALAGE